MYLHDPVWLTNPMVYHKLYVCWVPIEICYIYSIPTMTKTYHLMEAHILKFLLGCYQNIFT